MRWVNLSHRPTTISIHLLPRLSTAFFLLVVLIYLYVRRPAPRSPRQVMYQALHDLGEVLDHDLQASEKEQLVAKLELVIYQAPETNLGS